MPSQEPSSDAKSDEVDLPPDDTEDTDGRKTLKSCFLIKSVLCYCEEQLWWQNSMEPEFWAVVTVNGLGLFKAVK